MPAFELLNAVGIKAGGFVRPFYPFFTALNNVLE